MKPISLCVPDRPPNLPDGRIDRDTRCKATGKRIRVTDGYCNGCVPWGNPEVPDATH